MSALRAVSMFSRRPNRVARLFSTPEDVKSRSLVANVDACVNELNMRKITIIHSCALFKHKSELLFGDRSMIR